MDEQKQVRAIISKIHKLLAQYTTYCNKGREEDFTDTLISYREMMSMLSTLSPEGIASFIPLASAEIQRRGSDLSKQNLLEISNLFSGIIPYTELSADFTDGVIKELDALKNTAEFSSLKKQNFNKEENISKELTPFIKHMKHEAQLEFIGYIDALVAGGNIATLGDSFFSKSKEDKLLIVIQMINENNAYGQQIVKFQNGVIQMAIGAPNSIDVLILGQDGELHGRDVTMSTGTQIEGNQFFRHKVVFEHINSLFKKSPNRNIATLREITALTTSQLNEQNGEPYHILSKQQDVEEFFTLSSQNYHVLQQSSGGSNEEEVAFKNVIAYFAYFLNLEGAYAGTTELDTHAEIKALMGSIPFEFVGHKNGLTLSNDNTQDLIVENTKKLADFLATGKPEFIQKILDTDKGSYVSILKVIKYRQNTEIKGKKFPLIKNEAGLARIKNSVMRNNNQSDVFISNIITDIRKSIGANTVKKS